jgi:hypothetical protein
MSLSSDGEEIQAVQVQPCTKFAFASSIQSRHGCLIWVAAKSCYSFSRTLLLLACVARFAEANLKPLFDKCHLNSTENGSSAQETKGQTREDTHLSLCNVAIGKQIEMANPVSYWYREYLRSVTTSYPVGKYKIKKMKKSRFQATLHLFPLIHPLIQHLPHAPALPNTPVPTSATANLTAESR